MLQFNEWVKKKKSKSPDKTVDVFLNQIFGLAKDLDKAEKDKKEKNKVVSSKVDYKDMLAAARIALTNLNKDFNYYDNKVNNVNPSLLKVGTDDVFKIARELKVGFKEGEITPEVFRKAIEKELGSRKTSL